MKTLVFLIFCNSFITPGLAQSKRAREAGIRIGVLAPGRWNAITDVPGVKVGQTTLVRGDSIRTGVTAILPYDGNIFQGKVPAAVFVGNGFGKLAGVTQVMELGNLETPVVLTNTLSVATAIEAVVQYTLREKGNEGVQSVNAVVGETNDGFLNDIRGMHVRREDVWQALGSAEAGPVAEGCVGAGTGTVCFGFKGGIGTASRVLFDGEITVGALVQTNFGSRPHLLVMGAPIGKHFLDRLLPSTAPEQAPGHGSVMIVLATDAPASAHLLERMAKRAAFGLARTGSVCADSSGDFVIAFSTTNRVPQHMRAPAQPITHAQIAHISEDAWTAGALFAAVVESVEEAILNSLVAAETMVGRDNHIAYALPRDELADLLT